MASAMVNDNHVASSQADTNSDNDDQESNSANMTGTEDEELEEIKARVREMEEEAEKLKQMQDDILASANQSTFNRRVDSTEEEAMCIGGQHLDVDFSDNDLLHDGFDMTDDSLTLSPEEKAEIDSRSIFVGNVDYSATADDLEKHFHGCGSINRVTILCDKYTGHPKGYAYIEFGEKDSVETATALDDSLFKGRQIKVNAKRTNRPGLSTTNRPPRGRGGRGRGGGGGFGRGFGGGGNYGGGGGSWGGGGGGFHPRGGRRPFRARGWHGYSPY